MVDCWYALHVRSQAESLVVDKLDGAGIESFYPHILKLSRDRKRSLEVKFMAGYVFSRFSLDHAEPVTVIPQVLSILGFGDQPAAVPDSEIASVKLITRFPELAMPCPYVHTGDRVLVTSGPLRGLEGFVAYAKSVARVIVSIGMLGRSISAEVDAESLEMLEPATALAA